MGGKKLFAISFVDGRERKHVAAVWAATAEDALQMLAARQSEYEGFLVPADLDDVVEIDLSDSDGVQILWHQDYD